MNFILYSIQEKLKNINRTLNSLDIYSISIFFLIFSVFTGYFIIKNKENNKGILYIERGNKQSIEASEKITSLPFASKSGMTYTYSWCPNSSQIKEGNRIYFSNENEAKLSGRTLSRLCSK